MVWIGLLVVPAWAEEVAWYATPVVSTLHPVGFHYGVRYQEILAETLGGRGANPAWSPIVAEADVRFRFLAFDGNVWPISPDDEERWAQIAAGGAIMSVETLFDEAASRGELSRAVFATLDSLVGPGFEARGEDGELRARAGVGGARQYATRGRVTDPGHPRGPREPRAPEPVVPLVRTGFGWHLRGLDEPKDAPPVDYAAWIYAENIGITALRADWLVLHRSWQLSAREEVLDGLSVTGSAESAETQPRERPCPDCPLSEPAPGWAAPVHAQVGLVWQIPNMRGWSARIDRGVDLDVVQQTWRFGLRYEAGAPIPGRVGSTFGIPDDDPAPLPRVPDRAPLEPVLLDLSPQARAAAEDARVRRRLEREPREVLP